MRHDTLEIELKRRADRDDGQPVLDRRERLQIVSHHHIGIAAGEELQAVDLRATHLEVDVETGLFVESGRFGLIESAVLGLGEPTSEKAQLVSGAHRARKGDAGRDRRRYTGDRLTSRLGRALHCEAPAAAPLQPIGRSPRTLVR